MVALRWIISTALAASTALATDFAPAGVFIHPVLAKRQNESAGSPSYNCHDNCGQAIIEVRNCNATICDDEVFQTNYKNCLQCAGPDNEDIWQWYGDSLEAAAASCDLDTEPLSGQQESVGAAAVASNSTSACEAAAAAAGSASSSASASATATGASASASGTASASASGTASSAANAAPTAVAGFAAYGAVAVGALYAMGL
ncbi:putative dynactin arp1 p25 subunit [Diaporthe ampelina]|uniref:Putative dynactin arp1 p25 subunit n=1 Tax=Diaporthe ampelina TaxID=1214573 RepID=A0A0G2FEB3_9PEZI|nr:putative dynactin arp1 p25 subunit [Diaporthe ampelina]